MDQTRFRSSSRSMQQRTPSSNIQEILGQMLKNLQCPICLELMNNPVSTSCNHRFCSFCINSFFETKRVLPCPLCNTSVTKRSIEEQSQLSKVVKGIKQLIEAFESDTGAQFSPVKNASTFFPSTPEALVTKRRSNSKRKHQSDEGTRALRSRSCSTEKGKDEGTTEGGAGKQLLRNTNAKKKISYTEMFSGPDRPSSSNNDDEAANDIFAGRNSDIEPPQASLPPVQRNSSVGRPKRSNTPGSKKTPIGGADSKATGVTLEGDSHARLLHYLQEGSCGAGVESTASGRLSSNKKKCDNDDVDHRRNKEKGTKDSSLANSDTTLRKTPRGRSRKSEVSSNLSGSPDRGDIRHRPHTPKKSPTRKSKSEPGNVDKNDSPNYMAMQPVTRTYTRDMKQAFKKEKARARDQSHHQRDQVNSTTVPDCVQNLRKTLTTQASDPLALPPIDIINQEERADFIVQTPKQADNCKELTKEQVETTRDCEEETEDEEPFCLLQRNLRRTRAAGREIEDTQGDFDRNTPPTTTRPLRNKIFKNRNEPVNNSLEMQGKPNCVTLTLSQDPFAFVGETPIKDKKTGVTKAKKSKSKKPKNPLTFHKVDGSGFLDKPPTHGDGSEGHTTTLSESSFDQVSDRAQISIHRSLKSADTHRKSRRKRGKRVSPDDINCSTRATNPPDVESTGVGKVVDVDAVSNCTDTQVELFSGEDDCPDATVKNSSSNDVVATTKQGKSDSNKRTNSGQRRKSKRKNQSLTDTGSENTDAAAMASQEFKRMRSKISEAETHNLMFSTQEARQYMLEQQDKADTQEDGLSDIEIVTTTEKKVTFEEPEMNSGHSIPVSSSTLFDDDVILAQSQSRNSKELIDTQLIPSQSMNSKEAPTQDEQCTANEQVTQNSDIIMESCRQGKPANENRQRTSVMKADNDADQASDLKKPKPLSGNKDCRMSEQRPLEDNAVSVITNQAKKKPRYSLPNLNSMTKFNPLSVNLSYTPANSNKTDFVCETPLTSNMVTNSMKDSTSDANKITQEVSYSPLITKSLVSDKDDSFTVNTSLNSRRQGDCIEELKMNAEGNASSENLAVSETASLQKFKSTITDKELKTGLSANLESINVNASSHVEKAYCDSRDYQLSKKHSPVTLSLKSKDSSCKKDDSDSHSKVFDINFDSAICTQQDIAVIAPDTCFESPPKKRQDTPSNPYGYTVVPETELMATMTDPEILSECREISPTSDSKSEASEPGKKDSNICMLASQNSDGSNESEQSLQDSQPISSTYVVVPGRQQESVNDVPQVASEHSQHSSSQGDDSTMLPVMSSDSLKSVMSQSLFSCGKSLTSSKEQAKIGTVVTSPAVSTQNLDCFKTSPEIANGNQEAAGKEYNYEEMVQDMADTIEGQELSDYEDSDCVLMVHSGDRNSVKEIPELSTKPVVFGNERDESGERDTIQPQDDQSEELQKMTCKSSRDTEGNIVGLEKDHGKELIENKIGLPEVQHMKLANGQNVHTSCKEKKEIVVKLLSDLPEAEIVSLTEKCTNGHQRLTQKSSHNTLSNSDKQTDTRESREDESQSILVVPGRNNDIVPASDSDVHNDENIKSSFKDKKLLSKNFTPSNEMPRQLAEGESSQSKDQGHHHKRNSAPSETPIHLERNSVAVDWPTKSSQGFSVPAGESEPTANEDLTKSSQESSGASSQEENSTPSTRQPADVSAENATPSKRCASWAEENTTPCKRVEHVSADYSTPFKDDSSVENSTPDNKLELSKKKTRRGLATRSTDKSTRLSRHPKGKLLPTTRAALDLEFSRKNKVPSSTDRDPEPISFQVDFEGNQLNSEVENILKSRSDGACDKQSQDGNKKEKDGVEIRQGILKLESRRGKEIPSGRAVGEPEGLEDSTKEPLIPKSGERPQIHGTNQIDSGSIAPSLTQAQRTSGRSVSISPDIALSFDLGIDLDDDDDNDIDQLEDSFAGSGEQDKLRDDSHFDGDLLGKSSKNSGREDKRQEEKPMQASSVVEAIEESDLEDSLAAVPMTSSPLKAVDGASQDFVNQSLICLDEDDDSDECVAPSKKKRRLQITSDSEDESEIEQMDCSPGNATSSSAFSSQSELLSTQQREALEVDVATLQQQIAQCEAALENGTESAGSLTNASKGVETTTMTKEEMTVDDVNGNKEVVCIDVARERRKQEDHSDDDLFICTSSPSPRKPQQQLTLQRLATASKDASGLEAKGLKNKFYKQFQSPGGSLHKRRTLEFTQQLKKDEDPLNDDSTDGKSATIEAPTSPILSSQAKRFGKSLSKNKEVNSARSSSSCENMLLVSSGLKAHEQEMLQKFKHRFHVKFSAKFVPGVTHVIVKSVEGFGLVCERTLKFFRGLVHKAWVVDFSWILQSLEESCMLKEDDFEIQGDTFSGEYSLGPKKARLSTRPLLEDYSIACVGSCGELTQDDLKELLVACGANVVGDLIALPLSSTKHKFIIRCNDSDEEMSPLERAMLSSVYQQTGVPTLGRDWVLDCISAYQIIPVSDYQLEV